MASNLSSYALLHTTIGIDPVSRLTLIYEGPGTIIHKYFTEITSDDKNLGNEARSDRICVL